jgi:hypothetical protein
VGTIGTSTRLEESSQAPLKTQALLAKFSPTNFTSMVYSGRSGSHAGLLCGETNMPQGSQRPRNK